MTKLYVTGKAIALLLAFLTALLSCELSLGQMSHQWGVAGVNSISPDRAAIVEASPLSEIVLRPQDSPRFNRVDDPGKWPGGRTAHIRPPLLHLLFLLFCPVTLTGLWFVQNGAAYQPRAPPFGRNKLR